MDRVLHWMQKRLLLLLLATYALGAAWPRLGLGLRSLSIGTLHTQGGPVAVSMPFLMLGFLLVVAGLGTNFQQLKRTVHRPVLLIGGLAANTVFPIAFAAIVAAALLRWHTLDEAQSILVGLAMIGAMPIAGSSTAWAQNANANLALSLGMVLGSTLLSPVLTPLGLHAIGWLTRGDYSEDLHELATQGASVFVALVVLLPSLLGIALRATLGSERVKRILPLLKILNLIDLLLLNYSNAAIALPQIFRTPDWDFVALTVLITALMCVGAFASGWLLPRLVGADRGDQVALMFGIGMNNNGTGLVLASGALADHPLVLVPIIAYNLLQQMVAGVIDAGQRRRLTASRQPVES